MRSEKGFTLVEILIVIVVIAAIFSFMGITVSGMQNEAKTSKARADIRTIQVAVEAYHKNNGHSFPAEENYQRILLDASPRILPSNMFDPFAKVINTQYQYKLSPNGKYYAIYSLGIWRRGEVSVSDSGNVTITNEAIYVTNGKIEE